MNQRGMCAVKRRSTHARPGTHMQQCSGVRRGGDWVVSIIIGKGTCVDGRRDLFFLVLPADFGDCGDPCTGRDMEEQSTGLAFMDT